LNGSITVKGILVSWGSKGNKSRGMTACESW